MKMEDDTVSIKTTTGDVIKLKEFDMDDINPSYKQVLDRDVETGGCKIIVIGKTGTGKTTCILDILFHKRHLLQSAMIQSGSEDTTGRFGRHFPSLFIYNSLDKEAVRNYVRRQKLLREYHENPWSALVIDDCVDDVTILNGKMFESIFKISRHWATLFILALQYCMDAKPAIRTNTDFVFLLREPILSARKSMYCNFASIIPTFKLFCQILDEVTGDYTALVIDNRNQSNHWTDCVFWYKFSYRENFKFGSPYYWDFNNKRYDEEFKEEYDVTF